MLTGSKRRKELRLWRETLERREKELEAREAELEEEGEEGGGERAGDHDGRTLTLSCS